MMVLSVGRVLNTPAFRGNESVQKHENAEVKKGNEIPKSTVVTGLAALALLGTTIYYARKGKAPKAVEGVQKYIDKLPSRDKVLFSNGIRKNGDGMLVSGRYSLEKLHDGNISYMPRNGVNVEETIKDGRVVRRVLKNEKTEYYPKTKNYVYYSEKGDNLKEIVTTQRTDMSRTFKNQKALQDYAKSLDFYPKSGKDLEAIRRSGVEYRVYKSQEGLKEVYSYPETYPIRSKEVLYTGVGENSAKKITLNFREPQDTIYPNYKLDSYSLYADKEKYSVDMSIGNFYVDIQDFKRLNMIFPEGKAKAYSEIEKTLSEEFPMETMNMIAYGNKAGTVK